MKRMITESRGTSPYLLFAAFLALCLGLVSGCGNKFFDPTQVGRFRPVPAVNVILDSLGVAEEAPVAWEGAEEPLPIDVVTTESDYALRSGDTVRIQIFELLREGVPFINDYVVTETGKISIPEVDVVRAAGLTETQLEEEIKKILSPNILRQPSVSVILVNSQQRAFSIQGDGVRFPSRYPIPRYDFRLADALATAGGSSQFNVSYIYVSRSVGGPGKGPGAIDPGFGELELEVIEPDAAAPKLDKRRALAPRAQHLWPRSKVVISSSEMITDSEPARTPERSWQFDPSTSTWKYGTDTADIRGSEAPPETTGESSSVDDVLRTLRDRSARDTTRPDTGAKDSFASRQVPLRTESRMDYRTKLENGLRYPAAPTTSGVTNGSSDQNAPENVGWVFRDGAWVYVPAEAMKPAPEEPAGHVEWVFRNGRWVPVQVGAPKPTRPVVRVEPERQLDAAPGERLPGAGAEFAQAGTRLIRIPTDKLLGGDPRYNVVIKPGDSIFVPVDIVGECSVMGNVNRTGFINITGRPITLKQAIAAAGGLGPLAWPKRCEIVRRIGREKEEIVMVDLDKIASGEQPDFFIKPHDLINVGTHATARWRAVLRNAFRATYGFGFVYDRNFANKDFFGQTFNPITPWKWDKLF
ncbi:MAG: polysaccharide biosynthesis/export family protein [Planctomycetota bacterium]|nr:polysaccharide biosynthesis/export family protein [Planctomycetota bacterium]